MEGAMSCSLVRWAVAAVVLAGVPAYADPIVITRGGLSFQWTSVGIEGPFFGFDLAEPPSTLEGFIGPNISAPSNSVLACDPCSVGDIVTLSATFTIPEGTPPEQVWVGSGPNRQTGYPAGTFAFTSPDAQVFTEPERGMGRVVTPFEFNGRLALYGDPAHTDVVFESLLTGRGTAVASFEGFPFEAEQYWDSSRYVFAEVPEPATLLLVGGGLMSAGALRGRSRRSSPNRRTVRPIERY
jgi:hypothetical protein